MWIRTDIDFGTPYAIFRTSKRKLYQLLCSWCGDSRDADQKNGPEKLAKLFEDLVEHFHPELKGCTVVAIHSPGYMVYEVTVLHSSLPRVPQFSCPEPVELIPDEVPRAGNPRVEVFKLDDPDDVVRVQTLARQLDEEHP